MGIHYIQYMHRIKAFMGIRSKSARRATDHSSCAHVQASSEPFCALLQKYCETRCWDSECAYPLFDSASLLFLCMCREQQMEFTSQLARQQERMEDILISLLERESRSRFQNSQTESAGKHPDSTTTAILPPSSPDPLQPRNSNDQEASPVITDPQGRRHHLIASPPADARSTSRAAQISMPGAARSQTPVIITARIGHVQPFVSTG